MTIEVPEGVHRQLKAKAVSQGKTVKEVAVRLFEQWVRRAGDTRDIDAALELTPPLRGGKDGRRRAAEAWLREWDAIGREMAERSVDARGAADIVRADRR